MFNKQHPEEVFFVSGVYHSSDELKRAVASFLTGRFERKQLKIIAPQENGTPLIGGVEVSSSSADGAFVVPKKAVKRHADEIENGGYALFVMAENHGAKRKAAHLFELTQAREVSIDAARHEVVGQDGSGRKSVRTRERRIIEDEPLLARDGYREGNSDGSGPNDEMGEGSERKEPER